MMLEGVRPAECSYCWKVEDIDPNTAGDRIFKSRIYTDQEIEDAANAPWDADIMLKTVEVSFVHTVMLGTQQLGLKILKQTDLTKILKLPLQEHIMPMGHGQIYLVSIMTIIHTFKLLLNGGQNYQNTYKN